ncbi:hypothetical protein [Rubrivivax gelatinosus]|uniref:hypothetical protein n=1 Tax=Rubrivivax gelatinosus TaxID=28068 RepID=UPI0010433F90|nr:hypothetical protein [Rubrivivax gelatinosus]MBK1688753.1 hypothetical protein [Rubrivivax gelatinosus]
MATRPGDSAASVRARAFAAMAREAGLAPAARAEFVRRATTLDEGALNAPADSAAGQARARSAADASAAIQRGEIQVAPTRAQAGLLNLMKARDQQSVAGLPPAGAAVALPQAANVVPGTAGTSAVTPEVASAILANVASGRPPFNPELGQVGRVSWFVTAGDPYTST